ncbi:MAG: hypothetical protein GY841_21795, partial [FCB group bacterium]|nr:hypothetical protein [FCB group bacterium]
GENSVTIELTDLAGNSATFSRSFSVDSIEPTVEVIESGLPIADGAVYQRVIRPEIRSNKPDATISATLNGGAFLSGTEIATTGDDTIEATVTDSLGRVASSTVSFRLDLEAGPSITITSPQDGETLPDALTAVNGTVNGSGVAVTVNGSSATVAGDTWTVRDLALQPAVLNDIRATAIDQAGRSATATITVMVRTGGPQVLILEPADRARTNRERIDV